MAVSDLFICQANMVFTGQSDREFFLGHLDPLHHKQTSSPYWNMLKGKPLSQIEGEALQCCEMCRFHKCTQFTYFQSPGYRVESDVFMTIDSHRVLFLMYCALD